MIKLTEDAVKEIKRLIEEQKLQDYMLRIGIQGGGCSGLSYNLGFDSEIKKNDKIFETEGIKIVVDIKSLLYLTGTTLDFEKSLLGGGFRFENPNSKRTCGCGSSFST